MEQYYRTTLMEKSKIQMLYDACNAIFAHNKEIPTFQQIQFLQKLTGKIVLISIFVHYKLRSSKFFVFKRFLDHCFEKNWIPRFMYSDEFEGIDVGIDEFGWYGSCPTWSPRGLICGRDISGITYIHIHECEAFSVSWRIHIYKQRFAISSWMHVTYWSSWYKSVRSACHADRSVLYAGRSNIPTPWSPWNDSV